MGNPLILPHICSATRLNTNKKRREAPFFIRTTKHLAKLRLEIR